MKIAQKFTLTLLILAIVPGLVHAAVAQDVDGLKHRLFDPIPQDFTETRLDHMGERVVRRVEGGEGLTKAFMDEVRTFLLDEMRVAIGNVAREQGLDVNVEACAATLLAVLVEDPFRVKYGVELFAKEERSAQDPHTLPAMIFTYRMGWYVEAVLRRKGIPSQTRFQPDIATLISWGHLVYDGLGVLEEFARNGRKALETFGIHGNAPVA